MIRRRRAAWATTGIAVVLALVGCNFIVGVGDYQVGSEDGGSSEDDSGGNADGNRADARGAVDGSVLDTGTREAGALEGGAVETSTGEAGSQGDAGYTDGSLGIDGATPDANTPDVTLADTSTVDAGSLDAAHAEASSIDANTADVGHAEAGYVDAPSADVVVDQSAVDAGGDVSAIVDGRAGDISVGPPLDGSVKCGATLPGPTDTAFQQIVTACTLAVSCDPEFFDIDISGCITYDYFAASNSYACLRTIANCADFGTCWGIGYATNAEIQSADNAGGAVCTGGGEIGVNGDSINSSTIYPYDSYYDCNKLNGFCGAVSDPVQGMFAGCEVPPGTCTGTDGTVHCSNTFAYQCLDGLTFGKDCAAVGLVCVENDAGSGCTPSGTACSAPGTWTCNGTTLENCDGTRQNFAYDCSVAGGVCSPDAGTCVSPGCPPPKAPCTEKCDGDHTITVCVGGAPLTIDCTTVGAAGEFTSCGSDTPNSGNAVNWAWCAP